MKTIDLFLLAVFLLGSNLLFSQDTINLQMPTSINLDGLPPDGSAILDVQASSQGMLVPRTDTTAVNAAQAPATGLLIYQVTDNRFYYYDGSKWTPVGADQLGNHVATQALQLNDQWLTGDGDAEGIRVDGEGRVAVGSTPGTARFEVKVDSSLSAEVADQSAAANGDPLAISSIVSGAQSFTAGLSGALSRVEVRVRALGGGTASLELELRSGNDPSTGAVLTTESFDVSSTAFSVSSIGLGSPVAVTVGDPLVLIVRWLSGDNAEWERSATDIYPGGNAFTDASGWLPVPGKDHWFATYV